jgi:hypothetical protein
MNAILETGGERLQIHSAIPWVDELIEEAAGGELRRDDGHLLPSVVVNIESTNDAYDTSSWEPLTRGAWRQRNEVVMKDVCSSGFDLRLFGTRDTADFTFRWRPQVTSRAASMLLRTRFILLARAVLIQYPALWRASIRGRAPLHASACAIGDLQPLLAGPGGVGKSTLVAQEVAAGGRAISDNLCVSDGTTAWGVVEPIKIEGGSGRSMPHGRSEASLAGRLDSLTPNVVVVIRRGHDDVAHVDSCGTDSVARSLITGTYMAGELRRFWAYAATLSAGTDLGPPHAPVEAIARQLAARLPAMEIVLPRRPGVRLAELMSRSEAIA